MIPVWTERNNWVKQYIPNELSIIDWGCGNKDILRYIKPKKYLGIDILSDADIVVDFNKDIPKISERYDIGLVLGVLEYLDNPKYFLESIKNSSNKFIILVLSRNTKKQEWTNCFTSDDFENLVIPLFKSVSFERNNDYILAICSNK